MILPKPEQSTPQDRGLIDKVFDLTGEALEKFGNLFKREEESSSSQEKMPPSASMHSGKLMKTDRSCTGHIKKPSGFMSQKRDTTTVVMKVVDVDTTNGWQNDT